MRGSVCRPTPPAGSGSERVQPTGGHRHAHHPVTEVHQRGDVTLLSDYPAEPVPVVRDPLTDLENLRRGLGLAAFVERTGCEVSGSGHPSSILAFAWMSRPG